MYNHLVCCILVLAFVPSLTASIVTSILLFLHLMLQWQLCVIVDELLLVLQFIMWEGCLMEHSSIRALTGAPHSSLNLAKVVFHYNQACLFNSDFSLLENE